MTKGRGRWVPDSDKIMLNRPMLQAMAQPTSPAVRIRKGELADLPALDALEHRVFATDHLSRRSLRHFLRAPTAAVLVAEAGGYLIGTAIVLFRPRSAVARLYSIAVAPHMGGRGVGTQLLESAEAVALARGGGAMRLEVHQSNAAAISRYRKSGYREFGRHKRYYEDGGDALRMEKPLIPATVGRKAPRYFHQSTDFTCGPACIMMALAWADRSFKPAPALEFELWREATTIFLASGLGGCEVYGLAVTLKQRGLVPEIYASRTGPYFLETVSSAEKRRVMELTQAEFRRQAKDLAIPTHLTPAGEGILMRAFDQEKVAIVLVSGYQMNGRGQPHWVFAFGRDGRHILLHDPAANRDEHGKAIAPETYAVPWAAFERMTRLGRDRLSAAIVIRKGRSR
jgi:ribosomal protein S18 acetylase RimI-like enzyme